MDRQSLTAIIEATAIDYMAKHSVVSLQDINDGHCGGFASAVLARLNEAAAPDVDDVQPIGVDNFMVVEDDEDFDFPEGRPFDRALLAEHWPAVVPTQGLDWDGLDALSNGATFCGGTHDWLTFEGLHFDAETPQGVDNFLELPFSSGWWPAGSRIIQRK